MRRFSSPYETEMWFLLFLCRHSALPSFKFSSFISVRIISLAQDSRISKSTTASECRELLMFSFSQNPLSPHSIDYVGSFSCVLSRVRRVRKIEQKACGKSLCISERRPSKNKFKMYRKEEFSRCTMRSVSLFKKEWVTRARAASEKLKWNTKMCSRKEKLASTSSVFAGLSEKWTESLFDSSLDRRVARNRKKCV